MTAVLRMPSIAGLKKDADMESKAAKINVLELGPGCLFINKPVGISVHNESGKDLLCLVNVYINANPRVKKQTDFDPDFGVHPVHRLDKGTSGVILLAVNRDSFQYFSGQFESRQVTKRYVALVHGCLEIQKPDDTRGVWHWPLTKAAGGRKNPAGAGKRTPCETHYRVLGQSAHYTMLALRIHTGRTHQIRRHAKLAGHPVVGDGRYGSARAITYLRTNHGFTRLALHARSLTLSTEAGKEPHVIEAETIPDAMKTLFENDKIIIQAVDPRLPEVINMIADLDEYQASLYPPESNHLVDVEKLADQAYYFIAAFDGDRPIAIASFKRAEDYVEIKRLYVPKPHRGKKLAVRLMIVLQKTALSEGYPEARLETGVHQHEAIALYEKLGYERTVPFGTYKEDPLSVFMRKKL